MSVYVDDFKIAGAPAAMSTSVIKLDDPTPLGKYLGCNHTMCDVPASWVDAAAMSTLLRDGSDDAFAAKPEATTPMKRTSSGKKQRCTRYDMHGFMEKCVGLDLGFTQKKV